MDDKNQIFAKIKNNNKLKNIIVVFLTIACLILPFGFLFYFTFVMHINCTLNTKIHLKILKAMIRLKRTRKILKSYLRP